MRKLYTCLFLFGLTLCQYNCQQGNPSNDAQFELLSTEQTGLDFSNQLTLSKNFNVFHYMNFFNGGGVAVGDFNQDGLEDLFFTANQTANQLFLNQGELTFKNVTEQAKLLGQEGFTTGTSGVDINNDGLLDIFVGQVGNYPPMKGTNQLYVCQEIKEGIPIFEDKAADYGLAFSGLTQQATFFDYDLDGDLDIFQLNHSVHQAGIAKGRKKVPIKDERSGDRLLRNDTNTKGEIQFTEVTLEAGILSTALGFGLGVVTGDVNLDGWPDIYVSNDFHENDYLYINQQDGTFKESIADFMMHTSRFSMGVDMADINNDGHPEVMSLDMAPEDPFILKTSLGEDGYNVYQLKIKHGYHYQYARNCLQLNNGNGTFSDVGYFAGVNATDWSWSPLLFDFDHDGLKDLFVSNGIPRRMNDIDYVNFKLYGQASKTEQTKTPQTETEELQTIIAQMPQVKLLNKFFLNNGDITFRDAGKAIKNNVASYSNGAAYADLDNDGDLDIICNNIDAAPFIYKNLSIEKGERVNNYIHFKFKGSPKNKQAIGAKIIAQKGGELLVFEHFPVRGYMSNVALGVHIGLGKEQDLTSIKVIWPDGTFENLISYQLNATNTLQWKPNLPKFDFAVFHQNTKTPFALANVSEEIGLNFKHKENPFINFNQEALMPHMVSTEGPALAVGDVNGDGLTDVFFGGAQRKPSALFIQKKQGTFIEQTPLSIQNDSILETIDALLIDIDADNDLDLLTANGGNEIFMGNNIKAQAAYLNDGKGNFTPKQLFPAALLTAGCIAAGDFNGDKLVDIFIGGRSIPGAYGVAPESFLYQNKGNAQFELVTEKVAPNLKEVGMVKDAEWTDLDGDGDMDIVLALEWDAIQVFMNENNQLTQKPLNDLKGWWNFILPHDFDGDGDIDLLAGNLGENSRMRASTTKPLRLYLEDWDKNGQVDQILTYYLDGREYLFHTHQELIKQLPALKKKYLYATDFAEATVEEIFGKNKLANTPTLSANFMASAYFENQGTGNFKTHPLPDRLQFSTLEAAELIDLDKDGKMEVILGGNFYDNNIEMGRYDADYGNVLSIEKNGQMAVYSFKETPIKGQVRNIKSIATSNGTLLIFARNNAPIKVLSVKKNIIN